MERCWSKNRKYILKANHNRKRESQADSPRYGWLLVKEQKIHFESKSQQFYATLTRLNLPVVVGQRTENTF
jgi:hypothetical protein